MSASAPYADVSQPYPALNAVEAAAGAEAHSANTIRNWATFNASNRVSFDDLKSGRAVLSKHEDVVVMDCVKYRPNAGTILRHMPILGGQMLFLTIPREEYERQRDSEQTKQVLEAYYNRDFVKESVRHSMALTRSEFSTRICTDACLEELIPFLQDHAGFRVVALENKEVFNGVFEEMRKNEKQAGGVNTPSVSSSSSSTRCNYSLVQDTPQCKSLYAEDCVIGSSEPLALIFGGEKNGIPPAAIRLCNAAVFIPSRSEWRKTHDENGNVSSITGNGRERAHTCNVTAAAVIVLGERMRRRIIMDSTKTSCSSADDELNAVEDDATSRNKTNEDLGDTYQVLLFYKYCVLTDKEGLRDHQEELCQNLNLKGRLRVADDGINGCLGGRKTDLERYIAIVEDEDAMVRRFSSSFRGAKWKWGGICADENDQLRKAEDQHLKTLSVRICKEVESLFGSTSLGSGAAPASGLSAMPSADGAAGDAAAGDLSVPSVPEAGIAAPLAPPQLPAELPLFRGRPLPYETMTSLSEADAECVEQRHLFRRPPLPGSPAELGRQVVGAGRRCRHGWPQAIVYDPLYREQPGKMHRIGDTTRLTCPLLVSAIDRLEKGGAILRYTERLTEDPAWEGQMVAVNEAHRQLRERLVEDRPEEMTEVREHYGEKVFAIAMGAGLASMRPDAKPDVKCLHAQVADEFVRGGNNLIAQQALRDIEDAGIRVDGTDECCDNCNVTIPLELARWRLHKCKNTAGKRLSRGRKQATASARTSCAGSAQTSRAGSPERSCDGDDAPPDDRPPTILE